VSKFNFFKSAERLFNAGAFNDTTCLRICVLRVQSEISEAETYYDIQHLELDTGNDYQRPGVLLTSWWDNNTLRTHADGVGVTWENRGPGKLGPIARVVVYDAFTQKLIGYFNWGNGVVGDTMLDVGDVFNVLLPKEGLIQVMK
jgi:hypothetical protein